jgi:16S rRNA (uracil1498-N3)-methyltransferase
MTSVIRLYVDHPLGAGQSVPLTSKQSHYLFTVMRKGLGERLQIFNGTDGEWLAEVSSSSKKQGICNVKKGLNSSFCRQTYGLCSPL